MVQSVTNAMRKHPAVWLPAALRFAPWVLLLAAVMAGLIAWRIAHRPDTPSLLPLLLWQIVVWLPWLAYYPAIGWLTGRTQSTATGALASTALHTVAGLAIAASHLAWYWPVSSLLSPLRGLPDTRYGAYAFFFVFWFLIDLILYAAVLGGLGRQTPAPRAAADGEPETGTRSDRRFTEQFVVRSGRTRRGVLADAAKLFALGLVVAMPLAWLTVRGVKESLYGIESSGLTEFALIVVALLATSLVASLVPASRAAAVDPMKTLRTE